jgi:group I intron endonuclease
MKNIEFNSGVYKITNKKNGKFYIGSTMNFKQRFNDHKKLLRNDKHPNQHLQNAWNKYGEGSFMFDILLKIKPEKKLLLFEEQTLIDKLNACDKNIGYNLSKIAGSTIGYKYSEESKLKMSYTKLNSNSLYHNKILKKTLLNKDKEHYFINKTIKVKNDKNKTNPFYGKTHSEESKLKMSDAKKGDKNPHFGKGPMLGKKLKSEHKLKIGSANSGKNNKKSKPVLQYDLNMNLIAEWDSAGMAARTLNLSVGNIWMCCNGKARTSYGFIWKYKKL